MSCTVRDGDVLNGRRRRCLVWPEMEISCMAQNGDISYSRRLLLTLVRAKGIQPYWYVHVYTYLVALLNRLQLSFLNITISTGYEPSARYNLYSKILYLCLTIKSLKNHNPLTSISAHQPQHHHHQSLYLVTFLTSTTLNMSIESFKSSHGHVPK